MKVNRKDFLKLLAAAPLVPLAAKLAPKEPVEEVIKPVTSATSWNGVYRITSTSAASNDFSFQVFGLDENYRVVDEIISIPSQGANR
jgi:hypothetical protein